MSDIFGFPDSSPTQTPFIRMHMSIISLPISHYDCLELFMTTKLFIAEEFVINSDLLILFHHNSTFCKIITYYCHIVRDRIHSYSNIVITLVLTISNVLLPIVT